jgi:hypothetical protein
MLSNDLKLELFITYLFNLNGEINYTADDLFLCHREKRQIKEIFDIAKDILGTFLGTFTANEILLLPSTLNQFVHTQNHLGHLTAKNQDEIRALESAMK